jgi:hypothetical protein
MGGHIGEEDLTHDQFVVPPAYGVGANENGVQNAVGVFSGGLVGARTIEGPDGRLFAVGDHFALGSHLGGGFLSVNPDVFSFVTHLAP